MTHTVQGLAVSRGVAIGRAVLVASSRMDVAHYFVDEAEVGKEIERIGLARDAVVDEISRMKAGLQETESGDVSHELTALLDVHLMLLQDEQLTAGVKHWISERHYNAEWALTSQLELISRQFDEMEDPYLRERKADLEQVVERVLRHMRGVGLPVRSPAAGVDRGGGVGSDAAWVLVAHDLSPADMLQFRQSAFSGFVTDVGGQTSHTAIVARSMDIPAVVGARNACHEIQPDDLLVIDGDAGLVIVNPTPQELETYQARRRSVESERQGLALILKTPAVTLDGEPVELMANIEQPADAQAALAVGAVGVGLFRTEFLFMGRGGVLPDEDEQYEAYRCAVEGMRGLPVTIRTIDVGADKPLDRSLREDHLNPAMGLRAIRWSLAEPEMFLVQLRAILRAAVHGKINLLIPMVAHLSEIRQVHALLGQARSQLDERAVPYGPVRLGAMIEVPAAALTVPMFLRHFDFLSIGTNDLIQYTLAVDRGDEGVVHLYDPLHPAVLRLIAGTIAECRAQGKGVSVCGEMAGDPGMTRLLLGMGLRSFSMHPSQLLRVKQQVLETDIRSLQEWTSEVLASDEPAKCMSAG